MNTITNKCLFKNCQGIFKLVNTKKRATEFMHSFVSDHVYVCFWPKGNFMYSYKSAWLSKYFSLVLALYDNWCAFCIFCYLWERNWTLQNSWNFLICSTTKIYFQHIKKKKKKKSIDSRTFSAFNHVQSQEQIFFVYLFLWVLWDLVHGRGLSFMKPCCM